MAERVEVDAVFLIYAFRYALGRMTYAVGDVADALIANKDKLRPDWRIQIVQEIELAIREERAGMQCDVDAWRQVAEVLRR